MKARNFLDRLNYEERKSYREYESLVKEEHSDFAANKMWELLIEEIEILAKSPVIDHSVEIQRMVWLMSESMIYTLSLHFIDYEFDDEGRVGTIVLKKYDCNREEYNVIREYSITYK